MKWISEEKWSCQNEVGIYADPNGKGATILYVQCGRVNLYGYRRFCKYCRDKDTEIAKLHITQLEKLHERENGTIYTLIHTIPFRYRLYPITCHSRVRNTVSVGDDFILLTPSAVRRDRLTRYTMPIIFISVDGFRLGEAHADSIPRSFTPPPILCLSRGHPPFSYTTPVFIKIIQKYFQFFLDIQYNKFIIEKEDGVWAEIPIKIKDDRSVAWIIFCAR